MEPDSQIPAAVPAAPVAPAPATVQINVAEIFNALAPALATVGGILVGKLVPSNTQIGADAQAVFNAAFKLVGDVIAAKTK